MVALLLARFILVILLMRAVVNAVVACFGEADTRRGVVHVC